MSDWAHAPVHRLDTPGAYMVTAGTYEKNPFFDTENRLNLLQRDLFQLCTKYCFALQAWAIFPNHYHFIVLANTPGRLRPMISHLHTSTATSINQHDSSAGRKVWFQYWDAHLTYAASFYARLNYVHQNAVHHRVARRASNYPWCSAGWFERKAEPAFRRRIYAMNYDQLNVPDEFGDMSPHFSHIAGKRRQAAALQTLCSEAVR